MVRNFTADVKPDGSFSFDGVPSAQYALNFDSNVPKPDGQRWERIQLGHFGVAMVVPQGAHQSVGSMELEELALQPFPAPPRCVGWQLSAAGFRFTAAA